MDGNSMMANREWSTRPSDERFTSLIDLRAHTERQRRSALAEVQANRRIEAESVGRDGLRLNFEGGRLPVAEPTNWAFGQLARLAGAPSGYLAGLPAPLAADCLNYGLRFERGVEEVGLLIDQEGNTLRAATGPNYGRVWNADLVGAMVERFGDGISGEWKVPGEFGKAINVTKENTTLFAGDRDLFVFLADEERRVEVPNRRAGSSGSLARGFFVWNSEVGSASLGAAFFLFDYACCNRIVWGMQDWREVRIRHTSGAPQRWLEEVAPILAKFSEASAEPIEQAVKAAQQAKVDELDAWLAKRQFTRAEVQRASLAHQAEEGRPMATVWDAVVGLTAAARTVEWQDQRVSLERRAGALLTEVAS